MPTEQLDEDEHSHQAQAQIDQVVADLQHGLLEMRDGLGTGDQLGGFAEVGVAAGGRYQGNHLALFGHRTGVGNIPGLLADRQRLTRQGGLVHAQIIAFDQLGIGGDDVSQAQADDITRNQFFGVDFLPVAVPQYPALEGQFLLERLHRIAGLVFLPEAYHCIEHQEQHDDDDEIRPVPHDEGKNGRHLDHPGDGPPEVAQEF